MKLSELNRNEWKLGDNMWYRLRSRCPFLFRHSFGYQIRNQFWYRFSARVIKRLHDKIADKLSEVYDDEAESIQLLQK